MGGNVLHPNQVIVHLCIVFKHGCFHEFSLSSTAGTRNISVYFLCFLKTNERAEVTNKFCLF